MEIGMSEEKNASSVLEEGANEFGRVVEGVAGLLIGKGVLGNRFDAEETVISRDVDRAILDLGQAVGGVLLAAGEHLQKTSGAESQADEEDPESTPLVHGARSLSRGLAALAGDVLGSLQKSGGSSEGDPEEPGGETTQG
jgi:hypothetical protein